MGGVSKKLLSHHSANLRSVSPRKATQTASASVSTAPISFWPRRPSAEFGVGEQTPTQAAQFAFLHMAVTTVSFNPKPVIT